MGESNESLLTVTIREAVARHGSFRAAGRVLGVDHVYLHRLASGQRNNPSATLLAKLNLTRTVTITYARKTTARNRP